MEVIGKIIVKLPLASGTSAAGRGWSKQEYVLETQEAYPKKICFNFFGERATQYDFNEGDMVKLSFDIESREYNGRWFTNINGWKAETVDPNTVAAPQPQQPVYPGAPAGVVPGSAPAAPAAPAEPFAPAGEGSGDDLPF